MAYRERERERFGGKCRAQDLRVVRLRSIDVCIFGRTVARQADVSQPGDRNSETANEVTG